jgi:hypothetical protein
LNFDYPGYELKFIQTDRCKTGDDHKFTIIYKFFSPITHFHYILRAEYHTGDFFGVKFYCKKDRGSDFKYNKIINKGDLGNIIVTCIKVIPLLLINFPNASFGFMGARSVDFKSLKTEQYFANQRYRIYSYIAPLKIGASTFHHISYEKVSSYILINKNFTDLGEKENEIKAMINRCYLDLPDLMV